MPANFSPTMYCARSPFWCGRSGHAQFHKSGSGSLSIVATWLTGTYLLSDIIADFRHSHPAIRVSLQLGTAAQAMELLRSHHAELGFVAGAIAAPEIETEPLM